MSHELTIIRAVGSRHQAVCACGETFKGDLPEQARLGWYMHRIHAIKPACTAPNKKRYGTRQEAENAISRQLRRATPGRRPIHAYRCRSGQHWHTTSNPEHQKRTA
ncbi:hypothetical protein IU449_26975 [Nocardia higoensis]|uniref:Uncharacterized protein n=1 Tax=Nocardia higoensis TaxID=228599 RepID=A0ABS0DI87_9NOCA|nr:hypothetical protein [Nocardia higoensis]MBF6358144.1 hypothetical protein [Nocardia higoensis]